MKIKLFCYALVLMLCLNGCTKENNDTPSNPIMDESTIKEVSEIKEESKLKEFNVPSVLEDDEFIIPIEGLNVTVYKNISWARFITFDIVASQKIDTFEINIDTEVPYRYSIYEEASEEIPYYVFQSYQNVDWSDDSIPDYMFEYEYYYKYYITNTLKIYHYKATTNFELSNLTEDEIIKNITFNINGNEVEKEILGIELNCSTEQIGTNGVEAKILTTTKQIVPNNKGKIILNNSLMVCSEDIEIIDFYILGESAKITDLSVITNEEKQWTQGETINLEKGTEFNINATIIDENFVDRMNYYTYVTLVMKYTVGGKTQEAFSEYVCNTNLNGYEIIAAEYDDTTIKSYYYSNVE